MKFILGMFLFILGLTVGLIIQSGQLNNFHLQNTQLILSPTPIPSSQTPVTLLQPDQALDSKLISLNGQVKKIPWDKYDPISITAPSKLLQGDEIITDANSAAKININNEININLEENTDLEMSSLVGTRVLVKQKNGEIEYILTNNSIALNLVVGKCLLEINSGKFKVKYLNQKININTDSGQAKLGYYQGSTDTTKIWQITDGESFNLNVANGKITTDAQLVTK